MTVLARKLRWLVGWLGIVGIGCSPPTPIDDSGVASAVHVVFEPEGAPHDFGDVPFPDDLYLGSAGISLGRIPGETSADPSMVAAERSALGALDGFGATTPIFFAIDGEIDPSSLPSNATASLGLDASVFLVDVDSGSPDALTRIPVEVRWLPDVHMIALRPWTGHPLHERRAYAAIVTTSVRGTDGSALQPSPAFADVRDARARPGSAALARAWSEYVPVVNSLSVPRSQIAGLAVFHVQSVGAVLADARELVRSSTPRITVHRVAPNAELDGLLGHPAQLVPGLDVEGGVAHVSIGWLVDAVVDAPWLLSDVAGDRGFFRRDAAGALVAGPNDEIWMTLALPLGPSTNLPLVVFQHDAGRDRSDVLGLADALCAQGFAVLAIDLPFHGMRARNAPDMVHTFGGTGGPDLYADGHGSLALLGDSAADPRSLRDALRQSAVDVMSVWAALDAAPRDLLSADGGPTNFSLSREQVTIVGAGLVGPVLMALLVAEPRVTAVVGFGVGADIDRQFAESANISETALPVLLASLGIPAPSDAAAYDQLRFRPELALHQMVLDPADGGPLASLASARPVHVLLGAGREGELVPDRSVEALARALDVPLATDAPRYTDLGTTTLPIANDVLIGTSPTTRGLLFRPLATGNTFLIRTDAWSFEHPLQTPPTRSSTPQPVSNPTDEWTERILHFLATLHAAAPEIR